MEIEDMWKFLEDFDNKAHPQITVLLSRELSGENIMLWVKNIYVSNGSLMIEYYIDRLDKEQVDMLELQIADILEIDCDLSDSELVTDMTDLNFTIALPKSVPILVAAYIHTDLGDARSVSEQYIDMVVKDILEAGATEAEALETIENLTQGISEEIFKNVSQIKGW